MSVTEVGSGRTENIYGLRIKRNKGGLSHEYTLNGEMIEDEALPKKILTALNNCLEDNMGALSEGKSIHLNEGLLLGAYRNG